MGTSVMMPSAMSASKLSFTCSCRDWDGGMTEYNSVAGYGRAEGRTGSLTQVVFDVLCSFCSGGLGLVVADEDGLGGVGSTVMNDISAVSLFSGCGKDDGRILTAMQPFL